MLRPEARVFRFLSTASPGAAPVPHVVTVVLVSVLLATSCSRLTFVKPDVVRKGFERTAPEVVVGEGAAGAAQAQEHLQLSKVRLLQGDLPTAEREAHLALKLDPTSVDANTLMAVAKERGGDMSGAGSYYKRAVDLAPDRGGPLNNYGTWLCTSGRPAESLEWFDRALADRTYASPGAALANAGACADKAGQGARAERDLRRAIELDPNNPVALSAMAEREFRAGRAFEARAFSERRLAAAPADARSLQLASQIEEKLGDRMAAAKYVQRLRAEFPDARASGIGDEGRQ